MGCALRCEGGFEPTIKAILRGCRRIATRQKEDDKAREKVENINKVLTSKENELLQLKIQLEEAKNNLKEKEELYVEGTVDEKGAGKSVGDSVRSKSNTNVFHEVCKLQSDIKNIQRRISKIKVYLMSTLQDMLTYAYKEQKRVKKRLVEETDAKKVKDHKKDLLKSLRQCGTSLIGALVIGFDMESEGIPSALARVFHKVSSLFLGVADLLGKVLKGGGLLKF